MQYTVRTVDHIGSWTVQEIIDILQQHGDIRVLQAQPLMGEVEDAVFTIETEIDPTDLHGEVFYSHHLISNSNEFTVEYVGEIQCTF